MMKNDHGTSLGTIVRPWVFVAIFLAACAPVWSQSDKNDKDKEDKGKNRPSSQSVPAQTPKTNTPPQGGSAGTPHENRTQGGAGGPAGARSGGGTTGGAQGAAPGNQQPGAATGGAAGAGEAKPGAAAGGSQGAAPGNQPSNNTRGFGGARSGGGANGAQGAAPANNQSSVGGAPNRNGSGGAAGENQGSTPGNQRPSVFGGAQNRNGSAGGANGGNQNAPNDQRQGGFGNGGGFGANRPGGPEGGRQGNAPSNQTGGNQNAPNNAPNNRPQGGFGNGPGGRPVTARGLAPRFSAPSRTVTARGGAVGKVDVAGHITSIRGNGLVINRGALGGRTIISQRSDHTRLVSIGPRSGFVEHPLVRNGRPYIQRTYVVNRRSFARVYRGGYYHGVVYYHYVPAVVFAPVFYGWAYRPWGFRVVYNWGWGPWFGWSGYYFAPYPVYLDASMWLTDYVISQQLQDSYNAGYYAGLQAQNNAPPPPAADSYAPLTPELKQAISDEVKAQLAAENGVQPNPALAPNGDEAPDALNPQARTFIVATGLTEQLDTGAECFLAPGDILTRIDDVPDANQNVRALVSSSQANDCPAGAQLMVGVQDLQDMHNAFHERVDAGLNQLGQNEGRNGIPMGPPANPTPYADGTAQADPNAQTQLEQEQQAAQQEEQEVQSAQ